MYPSSPIDGQVYTLGGNKFVYDATKNVFTSVSAAESNTSYILQELSDLQVMAASGAVMLATKAELDAITTKDVNTGGWVLNDPSPANNGVYNWTGAAWVRLRDTFGNAKLDGSEPFTGTLSVTSGGMNVTGLADFNNAINVDGSATFNAGAVINSGGILVTGDSDFNQNVNIDGATTLNSATTITAGGLNVTGDSTFNNNLNVTGDISGNYDLSSRPTITPASTDSAVDTLGVFDSSTGTYSSMSVDELHSLRKDPTWTTASRPTAGDLYSGRRGFNTDLAIEEYYNGTEWYPVDGWIKDNLTLIVGSSGSANFADLNAVQEWLCTRAISKKALVTVQIEDGTYVMTSELYGHIDGARIIYTAQNSPAAISDAEVDTITDYATADTLLSSKYNVIIDCATNSVSGVSIENGALRLSGLYLKGNATVGNGINSTQSSLISLTDCSTNGFSISIRAYGSSMIEQSGHTVIANAYSKGALIDQGSSVNVSGKVSIKNECADGAILTNISSSALIANLVIKNIIGDGLSATNTSSIKIKDDTSPIIDGVKTGIYANFNSQITAAASSLTNGLTLTNCTQSAVKCIEKSTINILSASISNTDDIAVEVDKDSTYIANSVVYNGVFKGGIVIQVKQSKAHLNTSTITITSDVNTNILYVIEAINSSDVIANNLAINIEKNIKQLTPSIIYGNAVRINKNSSFESNALNIIGLSSNYDIDDWSAINVNNNSLVILNSFISTYVPGSSLNVNNNSTAVLIGNSDLSAINDGTTNRVVNITNGSFMYAENATINGAKGNDSAAILSNSKAEFKNCSFANPKPGRAALKVALNSLVNISGNNTPFVDGFSYFVVSTAFSSVYINGNDSSNRITFANANGAAFRSEKMARILVDTFTDGNKNVSDITGGVTTVN